MTVLSWGGVSLVICLASAVPGTIQANRASMSGRSHALHTAQLVACSATNVSTTTAGCDDAGTRIPLQACFDGRPYQSVVNAGCPVTHRLFHRLQHILHKFELDPIDRSFPEVGRISLQAVGHRSATWDIDVAFAWRGAKAGPTHLIFVVRWGGKRRLVRNTYCTGSPSTTIYRSPVVSCEG